MGWVGDMTRDAILGIPRAKDSEKSKGDPVLLDAPAIESILQEALKGKTNTDDSMRGIVHPPRGDDTTNPIPSNNSIKELETGIGTSVAGKLVPVNEFIAGAEKGLEYAVESVILKEGVVILAGLPKTGKSFIALDLALRCAKGELWLGLLRTNAKKVMYFDDDSPTAGFQDRVRKMMASYDEEFGKWPIIGSQLGVRVDDEVRWNTIMEAVQKHLPDIVIFDSLIRTHSANENDAREMAIVFEKFRRLSSTFGCAVLLIDHERKPSKHDSGKRENYLRGSTEKQAAVDSMLSLANTKSGLTLYNTLSRFTEEMNPISVEISTDEHGSLSVNGRIADGANKQPKYDALELISSEIDASTNGITRKELVACGATRNLSKHAIHSAIKKLDPQTYQVCSEKRTTGRGGLTKVFRRRDSKGVA